MTREEAIKIFKGFKFLPREMKAVDMAIKALEQESILDKIRAEIEPKCDRINSLASVLPYTAHREIQELLCEIMDLFEPQEREVLDADSN